MDAIKTLERNLSEISEEIFTNRRDIVDSLRLFYKTESSITAQDALSIASNWNSLTPSIISSFETIEKNKNTNEIKEIKELRHSILKIVNQLHLEKKSIIQETNRNITTTDYSKDEIQTMINAPSIAKLMASYLSHAKLKSQIKESKEIIHIMEKFMEMDKLLKSVAEKIKENKLLDAAIAMAQADALLLTLQQMEVSNIQNTKENTILRILSQEVGREKTQVLSYLEYYYRKAIIWKENDVLCVSTSQDGEKDRIMLSEFWQACEVLNVLPHRLSELSKTLMKGFLRPLISRSNTVGIQISNHSLMLTIGSNGDHYKQKSGAQFVRKSSSAVKVSEIFLNVSQVLEFLAVEVFQSNRKCMSVLSSFLWRSASGGGIEGQLLAMLQEKIPTNANTLEDYRDAVIAAIQDFEKRCELIAFENRDSHLHGFSEEITEIYGKKRRVHLLAAAREIMSSAIYSDSIRISKATEQRGMKSVQEWKHLDSQQQITLKNNESESLEDGCFSLPNIRISVCARQIMELTYQTLLEASNSTYNAFSSSLRSLLIQTSRDIIFLFISVIPTLFRKEIDNHFKEAMLFYNDCTYFAYHMSTIGYRIPLKTEMTTSILSMVDLIPVVNEAGELAIVNHIDRNQAQLLVECNSILQLPSYNVASFTTFFTNIKEQLNDLKLCWQEGLLSTTFYISMSRILKPLVCAVMDTLIPESIGNVTVYHKGKLKASDWAKILNSLYELHELFPSSTQAIKYLPILRQVEAASKILIQSIPNILTIYYEESTSAISERQLSTLIKNLFPDTTERKKLLAKLDDRI